MAPLFLQPWCGRVYRETAIPSKGTRYEERVNPEGNERVTQLAWHEWIFLILLKKKKKKFYFLRAVYHISLLSRSFVVRWIFWEKNFRPLGMSKGLENRAENSIKDTRPPVKDSVLELRTRMERMMSIVDITPRDRRSVFYITAAIRFLLFLLLAMNNKFDNNYNVRL